MLKLTLCVLLAASAVSALPLYGYWDDWWPYYGGYYGNPYYGGYWDPYYRGYAPYTLPGGKLIYYGEFHGTCKSAPDGLYYVDDRSFAFCSNGVKTIQPCAEGSANPPLKEFHHGQYYGMVDFCSINLVSHGKGHVEPEVPIVVKAEDTYLEEAHGEVDEIYYRWYAN